MARRYRLVFNNDTQILFDTDATDPDVIIAEAYEALVYPFTPQPGQRPDTSVEFVRQVR